MSQEASTTPSSSNDWTVKRVLEWTTTHLKNHGSDTPRLDAEILLAHSRGCQRIQLYTAFDEPLSDSVRAKMRDLVQRRAKREPVAYLVGHREFFSLDFRVNQNVLIPRPDSETLVLEILDRIKSLAVLRQTSGDIARPIRVLDLCTGSGCIAIAVAKNCQQTKMGIEKADVEIVATDISPEALDVARENAAIHKVDDRITFIEGDLFSPLSEDDKFDIIASNPPYIPSEEIDRLDAEVAKHEPRLALDGGPDGLNAYRAIEANALKNSFPHTVLLLEMSPEQCEPLRSLFLNQSGFGTVTVRKDLANRPRVLIATQMTRIGATTE
ncbi:MAG: peptide chain release factor N(5)-glutamine methyltransferase [Planctomycetes bacterium]|nr:peptide chain release factor N(5)-glutamine methyltransferase [Planctomycetota bacterium]